MNLEQYLDEKSNEFLHVNFETFCIEVINYDSNFEKYMNGGNYYKNYVLKEAELDYSLLRKLLTFNREEKENLDSDLLAEKIENNLYQKIKEKFAYELIDEIFRLKNRVEESISYLEFYNKDGDITYAKKAQRDVDAFTSRYNKLKNCLLAMLELELEL